GLEVNIPQGGPVEFDCKANKCAAAAILKAVTPQQAEPGKRARIVAEYDYQDETGKVLFQALRYEPKDFKQRQPDGSGGWVWSLREPLVKQRPLYHLPEVVKAVNAERRVYVCEGEKDADNLTALGLCATTCPMGARKWRLEHTNTLRRGVVVLIPDNDTSGREHVVKAASLLSHAGASVKVLDLPDLPDQGGDVSDWLDAGGTSEELERMADGAKQFEAPRIELPKEPKDAFHFTD
ncbi:unnamed protein product, partial [marine sediment metagenome]